MAVMIVIFCANGGYSYRHISCRHNE